MQNRKFDNDFVFLETFITELNESISSTNNLYNGSLGKKLNNAFIQTKTYWSILKTFISRKKFHYFQLFWKKKGL